VVHVFTPDFLATLARFDDEPHRFAPGIHFLATSPERADIPTGSRSTGASGIRTRM
jgi:hypothetical protein